MTYLAALQLGIVTGGLYALLGVSIVLLYRTTGVLSFAHAAFAMTAAYTFSGLTGDGWPRPLAAAVALGLTVLYGVVVERVIIRPLAGSSPATRLIATLGVLQLTNGLVLACFGFTPRTVPYLLGDSSVSLVGVRVQLQQLVLLGLAAGVCLVLGRMLSRSLFGISIRAVADNPESAQLQGVSLARVSRFNWLLGALVAGIAGLLVAPLAPLTVATFPLLLVKALVASLVAGLVSLPLAFGAGLGVGVLETLAPLVSSATGSASLALFLLVVVVLVVRKSWPEVAATRSTGQPAGVPLRLPPRAGALLERVRGPVMALALLGLAVLFLVVPFRSAFWAYACAVSLFFALQALSLVVLTGWGGQVSLMHGTYVGIGAFTTAYGVGVQGWSVPVALLASLAVGALVGVLVGAPSLRLGSVHFAIASVTAASAASGWLFYRPQLSGTLPRGTLFGLDLFDDRAVYGCLLVVCVLAFTAAHHLRSASFGALLIATRDNPATVGHFGVHPARVRLAAFAFASAVASLGGAFYGILLTRFNPFDFGLPLSLQLLVVSVVGGAGSLWGPLLGGMLFGLVPQLLTNGSGASASAVPDIAAGVAVLLVLLVSSEGLAGLLGRGGRRRELRVGRFRPVLAARGASAPPAAPSQAVPL